MDCILLRHGIAVASDDWDGQDRDRPLTEEGMEKTRRALMGLARLDIVPTHLLSSPLVRAVDTANLVHEVFQARVKIQLCDELFSDAAPNKLLAVLSVFPEDSCVLCVGHEPHLGYTAGTMLFGKPTAGLSLKKAGACSIHFEGEPKSGRGVLQWWMTPGQLRRIRKT